MITKKDLENFTLLDKSIESTRKQIKYYEKKSPYAIHGKVSGSSSQFPYTERTFTIAGGGYTSGGMSEKKRKQRIQNLRFKLQNQLKDYEDKKLEIQEFISDIEEPDAKLLFTYLFVDGLSQGQAGEILHMEQSGISKKLSRYLKLYLPLK
jgi:hypothetical protein